MKELSLDDFSLFIRLAECLSIAAVARERNEQSSQVSRGLSRLETGCGLSLFHRSTHGLSLTDEGQVFLEHAKRIANDAALLEDDLASRSNQVFGSVKISVACILADYVLIPKLPRLMDKYPGLNVCLHISDRLADMATEGIDLAIRAGIPPRDTYVARKLGSHRRSLYASPTYLAGREMPRTPADLANHLLISNSVVSSHNQWQFSNNAEQFALPVSGRVQADNTSSIVALALAGAGITRINNVVAADLVSRGSLIQVLADYEDRSEYDIFAVTLASRNRAPKIRACLDFLSECFDNFRVSKG